MIRDASTVMVLRESDGTLEVFMVKRHFKMAFMANAYVYPGGKLDKEDMDAAALEHITGASIDELAENLRLHDDPGRAAGLYLAAIRETFEESGFFLARRHGDDAWVNLIGDDEERFADYRAKLNAYEISLTEVARRESLVFPMDRLRFFAHWITPSFESRRFDTRFFVARAPRRQNPLHDDKESTDSVWISPAEALRRADEDLNAFYLAPPTYRTLDQLSQFATIDDVFAFCEDRTPPRILPHLDTSGDTPVLLLPGDPDFPDDPEYSVAEPVDDDVTRMEMSFD